MISDQGPRSGDRITTMDELRTQTGYGRGTIDEAARLLAERGSVEVRPGRGGGLFVAQVSPVVRLRQTLLTVPDGSSTVADAIAVRDALDELTALEAARHRTDRDVRELEGWLHERCARPGPAPHDAVDSGQERRSQWSDERIRDG